MFIRVKDGGINMTTKLTLTMDNNIIETAKKYAKKK